MFQHLVVNYPMQTIGVIAFISLILVAAIRDLNQRPQSRPRSLTFNEAQRRVIARDVASATPVFDPALASKDIYRSRRAGR